MPSTTCEIFCDDLAFLLNNRFSNSPLIPGPNLSGCCSCDFAPIETDLPRRAVHGTSH